MNAFKDDAVGIDSALPGTVAESGASSPWERLSLVEMTPSANGAVSGSFNVYWKDGSLVVYADVADVSAADDDTVTVRVGDAEYTIGRNGVTGGEGVQANVVSSDAGYEVVADIPYTGAEKDIVEMNVIATDSATTETSAWSTNDTGAVTLAEPLSYTEAVKVPADAQAPVVDADPSDPVWAEANEVPVDKVTAATPSPEATATAKTLWSDGKLYVLMEVTDADIDLTNSNPWEKDSVEVYIDRGNTKSGQYTNDIQQIRVSADGAELSFGSGASEDVQKSMVQTAGTIVDGGYVVEMAIDLGTAEAGTFEGVDFQINDAKNGARIGVRNWPIRPAPAIRRRPIGACCVCWPIPPKPRPPAARRPLGGVPTSLATRSRSLPTMLTTTTRCRRPVPRSSESPWWRCCWLPPDAGWSSLGVDETCTPASAPNRFGPCKAGRQDRKRVHKLRA